MTSKCPFLWVIPWLTIGLTIFAQSTDVANTQTNRHTETILCTIFANRES